MKKKLIVLILLCLVMNFCFPYQDMSGAIYSGKANSMDLDSEIRSFRERWRIFNESQGIDVYMIEKLTNKEIQLLHDALEEYDLKPNDVYTVQIGVGSTTPQSVLKLIVRINSVDKNGYKYSWWCIGKVYMII